MKSFLVATDFSDISREAALYAANLAKVAGAELTLIHAYLLPTPVSEVPYVMVSVDELQRDNEKLARELADHIHSNTGVPVRTIVNIGLPADEVVYQAKETGADLIVVGMRGENKTIDKIIGSTTAAIMRKATVPVLVVPAHSVYSPLNQITYATDFSYTMNLRCLKTLQELARMFVGARLNVVHIQRPGEIMNAEQIAGKVRLEPLLEAINHEYFNLEHTNVETGLKTFLSQHTSELLVMVAHKHSWWERLVSGSHTKEMAYRSDIPLLVLQDKD